MDVKNTFINFTSDAQQASSFMRQCTEPVPTIPRAPETPTNAAKTGTLGYPQPAMLPLPPFMMSQDPQREATAECAEDDSDLELEPGAFMPQVTEYEFGMRPQQPPPPSLFSLLSPATNGGMTGTMPLGIPTNLHMVPPQSAFRAGAPTPDWAGKTSVMLRNLPCDYTQQTLLAEVNQSGFAGTFGFFYLPIDKGTGGNKGYAFMDFSDASVAWRFKLTFDGRMMSQFNSDKLVSVMPAALQGFDANFAHYENSRVKRGDPSCRPLFFRNPSAAHSPAITEKTGIRRKGPGRLEQRVELQRREELIQQAVQQLASSVVQQQAEKREQPSAPSNGMPRHFCSSCGSKIKPGFQFCPNCGTNLAASHS